LGAEVKAAILPDASVDRFSILIEEVGSPRLKAADGELGGVREQKGNGLLAAFMDAQRANDLILAIELTGRLLILAEAGGEKK